MEEKNNITVENAAVVKPAANEKNWKGFAITGTILLALGVALCWIPVINIVFCTLSLVFFIIARKRKTIKRGLVTAGFVVSIFFLSISCLMTVIVITGSSSSSSSSSNYSEQKTDSQGHSEEEVWSKAKEIVSQNLKSPSTAKFCSMDEGKVSFIGDKWEDRWTIIGYVDAENSFGATLRSNFSVELRFTSNGECIVVSCDID